MRAMSHEKTFVGLNRNCIYKIQNASNQRFLFVLHMPKPWHSKWSRRSAASYFSFLNACAVFFCVLKLALNLWSSFHFTRGISKHANRKWFSHHLNICFFYLEIILNGLQAKTSNKLFSSHSRLLWACKWELLLNMFCNTNFQLDL